MYRQTGIAAARFNTMHLFLAGAIAIGCGAGVLLAQPADDNEADAIIAAAKRARDNARKLVEAIKAGDSAAIKKLVGDEINIGGKPTERTRQRWTMKTAGDITVVATSIQDPDEQDLDGPLEGDGCSMWGKLARVDLKTKTIHLEDVELIYVPKMDFPED